MAEHISCPPPDKATVSDQSQAWGQESDFLMKWVGERNTFRKCQEKFGSSTAMSVCARVCVQAFEYMIACSPECIQEVTFPMSF